MLKTQTCLRDPGISTYEGGHNEMRMGEGQRWWSQRQFGTCLGTRQHDSSGGVELRSSYCSPESRRGRSNISINVRGLKSYQAYFLATKI